MIDSFNPPNMWPPFGAFSMGVIQGAGQVVGAGDIRREFFSAPYPVTTTVQVAALYHADLMIEITAIAEIPQARFKRPAGAG